MSTAAARYLDAAVSHIAALAERLPQIEAAAAAIAAATEAGRMTFVFGSGHSHMLAEEAHYRAGGLAAVVPVLATAYMLHEGAAASTQIERTPGVADVVFGRYALQPGDVAIIVSNSGVNAAPVEAARHAAAKGATVIALTSLAYSRQAAKGRTILADLASIILDTGAPPGDAAIAIEHLPVKAGPLSTVLGACLLNAALTRATELLTTKDRIAPVYLSANMPGANEHNAGLLAAYGPRNPHL